MALGAAIAALAVWFMVVSKPKAGPIIDTLRVDPETTIVVRQEDGGDRNFVELRRGRDVKWQAMVPPYAGRPGAPGIAWNDVAVSVRVIRSGRAEIFALGLQNGSKLGGFELSPDVGVPIMQREGPVTLTDHERSYEIVAGSNGWRLVAFDLTSGRGLWKQDLDASPVTAGGVAQGAVWLEQRGVRKRYDPRTGLPL